MSYLVLFGLIVLIGLLNLLNFLLQWLLTPYALTGVLTGAVFIGSLGFCTYLGSCPPLAVMRRLCARAGCMSA